MGSAYVHTMHLADLLSGSGYNVSIDYRYAVGRTTAVTPVPDGRRGADADRRDANPLGVELDDAHLCDHGARHGVTPDEIHVRKRSVAGDQIRIDDISIMAP